MNPSARPPVRPLPLQDDAPRLGFKRGRRFPLAIAWFGFRSFWGHLWHLAASVIATEDIDSRDWMMADEPDELTRRVAGELLGRGTAHVAGGSVPPPPSSDAPNATGPAPTLTGALGGDLWIDFVADTGDDVSVSAAVARILFERYDVPDPDAPGERLLLPRGQLLVFGGDTAYPVATDLEIHNRVIVPWNRVLRQAHDGERRVLIGVPGNHDWYAGLDGFGRMFRRRRGSVDRVSRHASPEEIDHAGQIGHFIQWMEAFTIGHFVGKRPALPLEGYAPVQSASYWALHLAPGLDLLGPDRQLRDVDFRQRAYFADARARSAGGGVMLCLADPVYAFLEKNQPGVEILQALDVSLEGDGALVLTGDTHQYCRQVFGAGMHVTAGGGGAFLHPARIRRKGLPPPAAEFPGPRASLALALGVPFQIANGRSGFLVHIIVGLFFLPTFGAELASPGPAFRGSLVTALLAALLCGLIGGLHQGKILRIGALAVVAGVLFGFIPYGVEVLAVPLARRFGLGATDALGMAALFGLAVYAGTLVLGAFLTALTVLGLEQHQAFSALAHPGYKHFVRLRVRRDGSAVDGWVLGKVDPLLRDEPVVLVDTFRWTNPAARPPGNG